MKVLLVYPNVAKTLQISMGIAYISSFLKSKDIETFLWDGTFSKPETLRSFANYLKPDAIAFGALSPDYDFVLKLAKSVRNLKPYTPLIIGGHHATFMSYEVFNTNIFDRVIRGEAESSLWEYLMGYKSGYVIPGSLINIDEVPWPDHEMFKDHFSKRITWDNDEHERTGVFLTSRGCPFNCSYCSCKGIREFYKPYYKNYTRFRNIDDVINEIIYVVQKYNLDNIWFTDETFTINKERTMEFCKKYGDNVNIPFSIETRPDTMDEEMFASFKQAGCSIVRMGIESGVDKIRNGLYKRNISRKQIIDAFTLAKKVGLKTSSFNICGAPTETIDDIEETIKLNQECQVDSGKMTLFNVFPGTEMWDYCMENGYKIKRKYPVNYYEDSNFKHEVLSLADLIKLQGEFYKAISDV